MSRTPRLGLLPFFFLSKFIFPTRFRFFFFFFFLFFFFYSFFSRLAFVFFFFYHPGLFSRLAFAFYFLSSRIVQHVLRTSRLCLVLFCFSRFIRHVFSNTTPRPII